MVVHSAQVYIQLKPLFSRHNGIGVQFTDEPTGALDSYSARQLLETLVMLRRDYHATILMVTHDAFSASYCDRIFFLKDGELKDSLDRGEKDKQNFFADILDVMAKLTEEAGHVS